MQQQRAEERADARQREEREQRREDRREAEERSLALEARIASLTRTQPTGPAAATPTTGFTSNKSFAQLDPFSGEGGQSWRTWSQAFLSRAEIVGTANDNLRELRLKLTGAAHAYYAEHYAAEDEPALFEAAAMAALSSEFGAKYEEAKLWSAVFQYRRRPGLSGKDVQRALAKARQEMQAAGIPAHRSAAEDLYYILELTLSAIQRPLFLATLSSRADVSHTALQSLTPNLDAGRRESLTRPQHSGVERTRLFEVRLSLIEAFLDHDLGEHGAGGTARAAATCGGPDGSTDSTPPARPTLQPPSISPPADREAVVLILKA
jgi:hypothetical protein